LNQTFNGHTRDKKQRAISYHFTKQTNKKSTGDVQKDNNGTMEDIFQSR